ncbi:MAG: hypothetical protein M9959_02735 [Chitinophagaceae bacterium]|nr:hypothetical protein [Chitinophagaceae bacterium]
MQRGFNTSDMRQVDADTKGVVSKDHIIYTVIIARNLSKINVVKRLRVEVRDCWWMSL